MKLSTTAHGSYLQSLQQLGLLESLENALQSEDDTPIVLQASKFFVTVPYPLTETIVSEQPAQSH